MKIAIPVIQDQGLDSPVCEHFGSAPMFLVVDTDGGQTTGLPNQNDHHAHGACQPMAALQGVALDAIAVGGIGRNALVKFQAAGLKVFLTRFPTVRETVTALTNGLLSEVDPASACGHHGAGHGQGQGQGCGHGS